MTPPLIRALNDRGVSVWLDDLGRERLTSGSLQQLIDRGQISGVTTNPAIFAQAVARGGADYAPALAAAALAQMSPEEAVFALMVSDVTGACDLLSAAYRRSEARDGYVSIEVDPRLAHDTEATIDQAQVLWDHVARPNVMIKIPATETGLPAITEVLARGINVNVTLIFSLERYRQVRAAHVAGLQQALARGNSVTGLASVASFFVSRLDTAIDAMLDAGAGGEAGVRQRGTHAVLNARAAYVDHLTHVTSPEWGTLADHGALPQRPLWASTGTKDATFSPVKYVAELATPGAVNTVPAATLAALADWLPANDPGHGHDQASGTADDAAAVTNPVSAAARVLDPVETDRIDVAGSLARLGIDYATVVAALEAAGVESFVAAWRVLLDDVATVMSNATTTP